MAFIMTRIKVGDYDAWKPSFDKDVPRTREKAKGYRLFRNVDDPGEVFVMVEFASEDDAKEGAGRLLASGVLDRFSDKHGPTVVETLHMIAVCRLRHCPRTRAYAARRTAEGLSKRDIIRCLKRYIARELYHSLRADLTSLLPPPTPPRHPTTIACGAGPTGISRRRH